MRNAALDTYLARQPVFDRRLRSVGYEIFFRSGAENFFDSSDGDQATLQVIESTLNTFGLGRITEGGRAFINVTRRMLLEGFTSLLPPRNSVIEIPGSEKADDAIVAACGAHKKAGFLIALEDFTPAREGDPLASLADILKVDFQSASPAQRREVLQGRRAPGAQLLAKRVSTQEELREAQDLGYSLFQGFFFSRSEMMSRKQIPPFKLTYLEFLRQVNSEEADFDRIEGLLRRDVALSFKLLRYVNSAMVSPERRVESIRQAMTLVGLDLMRRWASMVALVVMAEDRPGELIVASLVRARFCEQLALSTGLGDRAPELFIVGMISLLDAIMGRPMSELLGELPLSLESKSALSGEPGPLSNVLALATTFERAEWDRVPGILEKFGDRQTLLSNTPRIPKLYREAIVWADQALRSTTGGESATTGGL